MDHFKLDWLESYNNELTNKGMKSFIDWQEEQVLERFTKNYNNHLEYFVRDKLKELGYKFTSDEVFNFFVRDRLSKISYEEHDLDCIYLDYKSESEKGILLVSLKNKIEYNRDELNGKITMSIG